MTTFDTPGIRTLLLGVFGEHQQLRIDAVLHELEQEIGGAPDLPRPEEVLAAFDRLIAPRAPEKHEAPRRVTATLVNPRLPNLPFTTGVTVTRHRSDPFEAFLKDLKSERPLL